MITTLSATYVRREDKKVVLQLADGQIIRIPRDDMEPLPAPGTPYTLQVLPEDEAKLHQTELAHTLLNQILNGGPPVTSPDR